MPIVTRHSTITVVVLAVASVLILGLFTWSGIYNIGADATHTRPVYSMLQMMRERSIAARSWPGGAGMISSDSSTCLMTGVSMMRFIA